MRRFTIVCTWLFLTMAVEGHVTPHPEAPDFQEMSEHHRRMRSGAPFDSQHINPAICNGLTEEECREMEDGIIDHGRKLRKLVQKTGFLRILVVPIRFTNHYNRWLPDPSTYHEIFNGLGTTATTPTGSIKDWIDINSYGNLEIEAHVVNWTLTDNTERHYSFGQSGLSGNFRFSSYPAFDRLEAQGFDFSRFDLDGDGVIDSLMFLHSGFPAEVGSEDCYNGASHHHRIWAHATSSNNHWVSPSSGIRAHAYSVASGLRGICHGNPTRISIVIHELMHTFGLPDLTDTSGDWIGRGTGNYDVMSNAHARNYAQLHPAHLSPWSKQFMGWVQFTEIDQDGLYEIGASELTDQIYVIRKHFPHGEYIVIENRQPILWDTLLWNGGLLIWHFDRQLPLTRFRGFPGQPGWPGNNKHYGLAIAQADGRYDIEQGNNSGDDGDFWRDGSEFGPGPTDSEAIHWQQYPNTNSYWLGIIQQTGLRIYNISASNTIMTFRVSGLSPPSSQPSLMPSPRPFTPIPTQFPTPVPTRAPTAPPTPQPTRIPTRIPTRNPTPLPTRSPTPAPSPQPTTAYPTPIPTPAPITPDPTFVPSDRVFYPTTNPSEGPSLVPPSQAPSLGHSLRPSSSRQPFAPSTDSLFRPPIMWFTETPAEDDAGSTPSLALFPSGNVAITDGDPVTSGAKRTTFMVAWCCITLLCLLQ